MIDRLVEIRRFYVDPIPGCLLCIGKIADVRWLVADRDRLAALLDPITRAPTETLPVVPSPTLAPPSAAWSPRRVPTSDDTIAFTPPNAVQAGSSWPELPEEHALPSPAEDPISIGWNACVVAAEGRVSSAIAKVLRDGGNVVDARIQAGIALRTMRRPA